MCICLSLHVTHRSPYLTAYLLTFCHPPPATLGKLLQQWQMASRVTFGDIQGSAFISVLQFTLVNEIHLCCQDGLLPLPPFLSGCPVYWEMARWRVALWLLSNVMLKKKIFNGLSVAFPALTCQVIRNISRSHTHPLSVFLVNHLFFVPPLPRGHYTLLITCYNSHSEGRKENRSLRFRRGIYVTLLHIDSFQTSRISLALKRFFFER